MISKINAVRAGNSRVMVSSGTCILIDAEQRASVVPIPDADALDCVLVPSFPLVLERARIFRRHRGPIVPTFIEAKSITELAAANMAIGSPMLDAKR